MRIVGEVTLDVRAEGSSTLGACGPGPPPSTSDERNVLRSRWRAIAHTDQPLPPYATNSRTSSPGGIPRSTASTATMKWTPTSSPPELGTLGEFDEHIRGAWRERAQR